MRYGCWMLPWRRDSPSCIDKHWGSLCDAFTGLCCYHKSSLSSSAAAPQTQRVKTCWRDTHTHTHGVASHRLIRTHTPSRTLRKRENYQPRSARGHGVLGLWTFQLSFDVVGLIFLGDFSALFVRIKHFKTESAAVKRPKRLDLGACRSSEPCTTFPRCGIKGADGITIWPTGVLLTVSEHTHPRSANIFQLDSSGQHKA